MKQILLIEDKIAHIELIETYLEQADYDYRLHKTHSLQDGLDIIRQHTIDIVLLDLGLVDSAGYNTLRVFQTDVHDVPVIVLTGYRNDALGLKIIQAGAQDFLVKGDFDGKQLLRAISYAILRYKGQVELHDELWKLRNRERRLLQLNQLALLGEWEMDVLNNNMIWSDATYQLLGYHPGSFSPKLSDYLRIIHSEDLERVNAVFQEAGKTGKAFQVEHRAVISNSKVKHLLLKGEVSAEEASGKILLIGILQDITELKKSESASINATTSPDKLPVTLSDVGSQIRKPLSVLQNSIEYTENIDNSIQQEIAKVSKSAIVELTDLVYKQMNIKENGENNLSQKPATMLVIEPQTIMQIAIKHMIRTSSLPPIHLDFVSDIETGIQKYNENQYDILFLDIPSSISKSTELIRQLNGIKPTNIIALASAFSEADKSLFYDLGVKTLLTKPLKREEFLPPLSQLLQ